MTNAIKNGWSPDHQKFNDVLVYVPRASDMIRTAVTTYKKDSNLPMRIRIFNDDGSYCSHDIDLGFTAGQIANEVDINSLDGIIREKAEEFFIHML